MANKKSLTIIIAVVAILVIIFLAGKSQPQGVIQMIPATPEQCEIARANLINDFGSQCVSDCFMVDRTKADCFNECLGGNYVDGDYYAQFIGDYRFFAEEIECNQITEIRLVCEMECIGFTNQDCNTLADYNCDGCVSDIEFPQGVSSWLNQEGVSDTEFPLVVSNWMNQEGC